MDESLRHQRDTALREIEALIERGCQIRAIPSPDATRAWQRDCAAAINQLSGGSKAHWLSRAYSGAFLVRSSDGGVIVEADRTDIVDRILGVLEQGAASLSDMDEVTASSAAAPPPRRFDFVQNADLRPVLERVFADSRDAFERGEFALALVLSCSVIESLLTDGLSAGGGPPAAGSFDERIEAAERVGIIRGGCARLPAVARAYHDLTDEAGELRAGVHIAEREARLAGQVLRVVMRDLDPGR